MNTPVLFWKKLPALRWLLPFLAGIYATESFHLSVRLPLFLMALCCSLLFLLSLQRLRFRFRFTLFTGFLLQVLTASLASLITWKADIRHHPEWLGKREEALPVVVRVEEPFREKAKTYSTVAAAAYQLRNGKTYPVNGRVLLYFLKSSGQPAADIGDAILILKPLIPLPCTANPAGFDYRLYCLRKGITHQVFLSQKDYRIVPKQPKGLLSRFVQKTRKQLVSVLQKQIKGEKERGLAEALLIGYEEDLDRGLVQAYSQTGVVHVIAISGLHLGLIYGFLLWLTRSLDRRRMGQVLRFLLLLSFLWLFTLLAGAQPSVLRSAVMFSFLGAGTLLRRQASVYQSLSLSALLLLAYNPYWLWDIGFQLSYLAVWSLSLFYRPVYRLLHCRNPLANQVWKLAAGTLAVQVLTFPAVVYHFHQFPLLVLFTNMVVVPLSSLILTGEIVLLLLAPLPAASLVAGALVERLIYWMDRFVERTATLPYTTWQGLSLTLFQTALLLLFIGCLTYGLKRQRKPMLYAAGSAILLFLLLRWQSFYQCAHQQRLVVYSIPGHQAIDLFAGRAVLSLRDTVFSTQGSAPDFYTGATRIAYRAKAVLVSDQREFTWKGRHLLVLDRTYLFRDKAPLPILDLLVVSGGTRNRAAEVLPYLRPKQVVTDGSLPPWKTALWKAQCDSLRIPFYDVKQQGGFVMNL